MFAFIYGVACFRFLVVQIFYCRVDYFVYFSEHMNFVLLCVGRTILNISRIPENWCYCASSAKRRSKLSSGAVVARSTNR